MKHFFRSYIPEEWSTGVDHIQTSYFYFNNFLSEEDCEVIKDWGHNATLQKGTIMASSDQKIAKQVRTSDICWMPTDGWEWLYDKIYSSAERTNKWNYDIRGFGELIQFTKYDASEEPAFYNTHRDTGPNHQHRKISFVILLDDPEDFEGGEFNLESVGNIDLLKKGTAIMFPSFMSHQVLPVTKGIRHSLVCWISGPKLR